MSYLILKELLPSMVGTEGYDENMNFIEKCMCIDNDELFIFDTIEEAESKKSVLINDERYVGRTLKIKERV